MELQAPKCRASCPHGALLRPSGALKRSEVRVFESVRCVFESTSGFLAMNRVVGVCFGEYVSSSSSLPFSIAVDTRGCDARYVEVECNINPVTESARAYRCYSGYSL